MPRNELRNTLVIPLSLLVWFTSALALDVPPLTGRIVDLARLIPSDVEASLTAELAEHERKTGNQIAVLTLPSLEGEPIEAYSHRVATTWKLGQKGSDNGVLLLVVPAERRLRIEVGYGLEGTLTDAATSRIIRQLLAPRFRGGDFPGGITAGVHGIMRTIEGTDASTDRSPAMDAGTENVWSVLVIAVVLGAMIGIMVGRSLRVLGGFVGGLLSFFMAMSAGMRLALVAGVIGMIAAVVLGAFSGGPRRGSRSWNGGWGPGWGGGYGGGFPSSSDTFGGGGGDFGGGGASGRW